MLEHARNLEFEKAARVRDQLAMLKEQAFGAVVHDNVVCPSRPPSEPLSRDCPAASPAVVLPEQNQSGFLVYLTKSVKNNPKNSNKADGASALARARR